MHGELIKEEAHGWTKRWVYTGDEWIEVSVPPEDYRSDNPYEGTGLTPESTTIHPDNIIGDDQ